MSLFCVFFFFVFGFRFSNFFFIWKKIYFGIKKKKNIKTRWSSLKWQKHRRKPKKKKNLKRWMDSYLVKLRVANNRPKECKKESSHHSLSPKWNFIFLPVLSFFFFYFSTQNLYWIHEFMNSFIVHYIHMYVRAYAANIEQPLSSKQAQAIALHCRLHGQWLWIWYTCQCGLYVRVYMDCSSSVYMLFVFFLSVFLLHDHASHNNTAARKYIV